MLVGGNIDHQTRVLTTAIVLETRKGNFRSGDCFGVYLALIGFYEQLLHVALAGKPESWLTIDDPVNELPIILST